MAPQQKKKQARFLGDSKRIISSFSESPRLDVGYQIWKLEMGEAPDDWKPMPGIGAGAAEIRVAYKDGWYRVFYVAKFADFIYVLHAIQKKTNQTPPAEVALARKRYGEIEAVLLAVKAGKNRKG